jgi:hypothetical protein
LNLFAGLLRHARDGGTYFCRTLGKKDKNRRVLMNSWAQEGRAKCYSLDYGIFEEAVLSMLREIDPRAILEGVNGHGELIALEDEKGQLENSMATIAADLDANGESPVLYARLRAKEARLKILNLELLPAARQKAANPLSAAWGEMQSLVKVVGEARSRGDQDTLLRFRAVLRRVVDSIWLLIVPRGRNRLCAVQIWFQGAERHRDYLILHKPPMANPKTLTLGSWYCGSLADIADPRELDLRRPEDAQALEAEFLELDLAKLELKGN